MNVTFSFEKATRNETLSPFNDCLSKVWSCRWLEATTWEGREEMISRKPKERGSFLGRVLATGKFARPSSRYINGSGQEARTFASQCVSAR